MKIFRIKFLINILTILLFFIFVYLFVRDSGRLIKMVPVLTQPCQKPITYSITNFDPRFGLTEAKLLDNIKQAENIWEAPISRQLFEHSATGDLKINFIYDYRQKATDDLKKIGIVIHDDRASYEELKIKYESFISSYEKQKVELDALLAIYNADKDAFEKDVDHWNKRGGAPKAEYDALEQKRADLNNQVVIINEAKDALNELVDILNSTEEVLNQLVAKLNLQVNTYNAVSSSTGREFSEGEYVRNADGTTINIFQFDNEGELVEVLVHELGHALDLGHLDNPKAIMYYLNEGMNRDLTEDDLSALKTVCRIK